MHPELLPLLACPLCPGSDLILSDPVLASAPQEGRILSGQLTCARCGQQYPIRQGIPRFVTVSGLKASEAQQTQGAIAQNFGDAWQIYAEERRNPYTEDQFLDWIIPLQPADFKDQIVLDVGSGLGGFMEYAATYGPRHIIGLEISHAIDAAAPLLQAHPNLSLVQGNILQPPFKPGVLDLMYSIGVLHHLEEPETGFRAVAPLLKPGGRFLIWVYGRENNGLVVWIVDPLRKLMSKLPVRVVRYGVAFPMSLVLFPLLHTLYHPVMKPWLGKLPYFDYFQWLRQYGFGYVVGMVTDQLIPPRTFYQSKADVLGWYERAQLALESITPRNNISWRALGRR